MQCQSGRCPVKKWEVQISWHCICTLYSTVLVWSAKTYLLIFRIDILFWICAVWLSYESFRIHPCLSKFQLNVSVIVPFCDMNKAKIYSNLKFIYCNSIRNKIFHITYIKTNKLSSSFITMLKYLNKVKNNYLNFLVAQFYNRVSTGGAGAAPALVKKRSAQGGSDTPQHWFHFLSSYHWLVSCPPGGSVRTSSLKDSK